MSTQTVVVMHHTDVTEPAGPGHEDLSVFGNREDAVAEVQRRFAEWAKAQDEEHSPVLREEDRTCPPPERITEFWFDWSEDDWGEESCVLHEVPLQ